jgi:hypothetical protein
MLDVSRGSKGTYATLMNDEHLFKNSKLYGVLMTLSLMESKLLVHLPWLHTDFAETSGGFPNLRLLRQGLCGSLVQIFVTFVGQLGVLAAQKSNSSTSSTFFVILIINVAFSSIKLLLALLESLLKFNVLAGNGNQPQSAKRKKSIAKAHANVTANPIVQPASRSQQHIGEEMYSMHSVYPPEDVSLSLGRLSFERAGSITAAPARLPVTENLRASFGFPPLSLPSPPPSFPPTSEHAARPLPDVPEASGPFGQRLSLSRPRGQL